MKLTDYAICAAILIVTYAGLIAFSAVEITIINLVK